MLGVDLEHTTWRQSSLISVAIVGAIALVNEMGAALAAGGSF